MSKSQKKEGNREQRLGVEESEEARPWSVDEGIDKASGGGCNVPPGHVHYVGMAT